MKQLQGFHQTRHVWLKSYAWHYRTLYLKKKENEEFQHPSYGKVSFQKKAHY